MKKNRIAKVIEKRPGKWPEYYDEREVENYQEYFIKGTNVKIGFTCYDKEQDEIDYCCIVTESQDDQDYYDSEEELFKHFEYILMNPDFGWRYFY